MKPIRIILVDDNEDSLEILQHFIQLVNGFEIIATYQSGETMVQAVISHEPDLVLTDIQMPKLNGLEGIKQCLKVKPDLKFIFTTSYDNYAVEAFDISALDYIVKPIDKVRLFQALEKARIALMTERTLSKDLWKRLTIKYQGSFYYIPFKDIIFIEKIGKKSFIYTKNDEYFTYKNISDLYKELDSNQFFMTHRSYIVNLEQISYITPKNETYFIYFFHTDRHAHLSRLKLEELQNKIRQRLTR